MLLSAFTELQARRIRRAPLPRLVRQSERIETTTRRYVDRTPRPEDGTVGVCVDCLQPSVPDRVRCAECLAKHRRYFRERYWSRQV